MADWSIYKKTGSGGSSDLTDPKQLPAAQEHKIILGIVPNANISNVPTVEIEGFMKEPFNYSVGAQYNKIWDVPATPSGLIRYGKDIINADASYHSGFFSKKMFEPGNAYSKLDLKFRVYDKPTVIQDCSLLVACCLPMIESNSPALSRFATGALKKTFVAAVSAGYEIGKELLTGDVVEAADTAVNAIMDIGTTRKPPHINVSIGSYFKKYDMVITNLDFTYSKEFVYSETLKKSYPLYVDFNISVESLFSMLAINNVGEEMDRVFGAGFEELGASRIKIVNAAVNENPIMDAWNSFKDGNAGANKK